MPGFDGTGPNGLGPQTGRAGGPCVRRGFGRGWFNSLRQNSDRFGSESLEEAEKELESRLEEIKKMRKESEKK